MKKALLVALTVGLIGALLVAAPTAVAAKKKKPRVFKGTYSCPCGVSVNGVGQGFRLGEDGGFDVPVLAGEKSMKLEITDDAGLPVYFEIAQDVDGDGTFYEHDAGTGCGKTADPAVLEPGAPIIVFVYSGSCDGGPAFASGGTFKATLSK